MSVTSRGEGMPGEFQITGATSIIGPYLLDKLSGPEVHAFSRHPPALARPDLNWHALDLERPAVAWPVRGVPCLVHLAPIWLLPAWVDALADAGVRRVVAVGSTSRSTKAGSASPRERELARRLAQAEESLADRAARRDLRWTVLRPTLVYDGLRDRNLADARVFIARWGFFPIAGEGRGLRQPVHADDVAVACLSAARSETAVDRVYDLAGGGPLTYRAMIEVVFESLGRRPRIVRMPLLPLRLALTLLSWAPGFRHVTPEMATRMDQDLCFGDADARRDLSWAPRPFSKEALASR